MSKPPAGKRYTPPHPRRLFGSVGAVLAVFFLSTSAMAIDLAPLWDYSKPAISEERFRAALVTAQGDDALILETQIARTYGLRKQFDKARAHLDSIAPRIQNAGAETRAHYALELGRTHASAAHSADSQTPESRQLARLSYQRALEIARSSRLDGLAIDAIHMLAFVDTAPADQLRWAQEALAVVEGSAQPAAKAWEPSIRNNNLGYALHQLGRYQDALDQFQQARALQLRLEQENDAAGEPEIYVFEELEILYRERGDTERATHYAARHKAVLATGK